MKRIGLTVSPASAPHAHGLKLMSARPLLINHAFGGKNAFAFVEIKSI